MRVVELQNERNEMKPLFYNYCMVDSLGWLGLTLAEWLA